MQRDLANAHQRSRDLSNQLHQQGQALLKIPLLEASLEVERGHVSTLNEEVRTLRNMLADYRQVISSATNTNKIGPIVTEPVAMLLWCPACHERHIDVELKDKPHHTHACQHCGMTWRPARVATLGVQFIPGFKDAVPA